MKISIITVCYNSEKTIEKTILSVLSQSYKDIEYIIIDGQSTDGTLAIIDKYKDKLSYFISEKDKGLYDAMNKGVKAASGDFIGILNSDDVFFSKNVISNIADFHTAMPRIKASVGNIIQINEEGKKVRNYSSKNWKPHLLKFGFMPPHPSIFFSKDLFSSYGYYKTDYKIGADYELITRFFLKNRIEWAYSKTTTTTMLIGGLSSSGLESYRRISKEIKRALKENKISFLAPAVDLRFLWKIVGKFINV